MEDKTINRNCIYFNPHSTLYKKPFGAITSDVDGVIFRIKTDNYQVELAQIQFLDPENNIFSFTMKRSFCADGWHFFEIKISCDKFIFSGVYRYKFILSSVNESLEYGAAQDGSCIGAIADFNAIPFNLTVTKEKIDPPSWFINGVAYQIFVDRFFDGNANNNDAKKFEGCTGKVRPGERVENKVYPLRNYSFEYCNEPDSQVPEGFNVFFGGDLQGIIDKLDYLEFLGVNILYLNPISWATSNHKYDVSDYHHLDPSFGNPIFNNNDPVLGLNNQLTREKGDEFFITFCRMAKLRGFHVVLDGVFNHVGADSIYFNRYEKYEKIGAYPFWNKVWDRVNDLNETESEAKLAVISDLERVNNPLTGVPYQYPNDFQFIDWFDIRNKKFNDSDIYQYECWYRFDHMPAIKKVEMSQDDSDGLEGLHSWNIRSFRRLVLGENLLGKTESEANEMIKTSAAHKWPWMGSSGWRIDAAPMITNGTWKKFCGALRSLSSFNNANGERIINQVSIGEVWDIKPDYLLGDMFDSVTNYPLKIALDDFILKGDAYKFHLKLEEIRESYPEKAWRSLFNFFDSHDTSRLITLYRNSNQISTTLKDHEIFDLSLRHVQVSVLFLLTYPGVPSIFYGDEVGLDGGYDPACRKPFPWGRIDKKEGMFFSDEKYQNLFSLFKNLIDIRKRLKIFSFGTIQLVYAENDVLVYFRKFENQTALVVINRKNESSVTDLNVSNLVPNGVVFEDILSNSNTAPVTNGILTQKIEPLSGAILFYAENKTTIGKVESVKAVADGNSVFLSWKPAENAVNYVIYRCLTDFDASDNHYEIIGRIADGNTSFTDNNFCKKTTYHYAVAAYDGLLQGELIKVILPALAFDASNSIKIKDIDNRAMHVHASSALDCFEVVQLQNSIYISWNKIDPCYSEFYIQKISKDNVQTLIPHNHCDEFIDNVVEYNYEYAYRLYAKKNNTYFFSENIKIVKVTNRPIDITIKLIVPSYTPHNAEIYISGEFNNYNITTHRLIKSDSEPNIWFYHFQAYEGFKFKNYSFYRDGSLYKNGFLSSNREANDPECPSNWAYFDFNTNQSFVVQNHGGNAMQVTDYILRWMDFPLVFIEPVLSLSGDIEYITKQRSVVVHALIPFDSCFLLNGELIASQSQGHIKHEIPLEHGKNIFQIETYCSDVHKRLPWAHNDWHMDFAKRSIKLIVNRINCCD